MYQLNIRNLPAQFGIRYACDYLACHQTGGPTLSQEMSTSGDAGDRSYLAVAEIPVLARFGAPIKEGFPEALLC